MKKFQMDIYKTSDQLRPDGYDLFVLLSLLCVNEKRATTQNAKKVKCLHIFVSCKKQFNQMNGVCVIKVKSHASHRGLCLFISDRSL